MIDREFEGRVDARIDRIATLQREIGHCRKMLTKINREQATFLNWAFGGSWMLDALNQDFTRAISEKTIELNKIAQL